MTKLGPGRAGLDPALRPRARDVGSADAPGAAQVGPRANVDATQARGPAPSPDVVAPSDTPRASAPPTAPRAPTPGTTTSTWATFASQVFQSLKGPVAAVLLGASALPGLGGAALAQELPAARAAITEDVRASARAPALVSSRIAARLPAGALEVDDLARLHLAASIRDRAAMRAAFEAAPTAPAQAQELARFDDVIRRLDALVAVDGQLSPALFADVDHLLGALADARPGQLGATIDRALRTLPSLAAAPRGPATPTAPALGRLDRGGLRALLTASPTELPARAASTFADYAAFTAGLHGAFTKLPPFEVVSPVPLGFTRGDTQLSIPPGARVLQRDGQISIRAPEATLRDGGVIVVARDAEIALGDRLDGLTASTVDARGEGWALGLDRAALGLSAQDGVAFVRASGARFDLGANTARLTNAELQVSAAGALGLTASSARVDADGRALALDGLSATQTRDETRIGARAAEYSGRGTTLRASTLDLTFGPSGARFTSDALTLASGGATLDATAARGTLTPLAGGGHALTLGAERLAFADGHTRLTGQGGLDARLQLDADGRLRAATWTAGELSAVTRDGTFALGQTEARLAFDPSGHLTQLSARGASAAFTGGGRTLDVTRGALDATFARDGRLERVGGEAAALRFVDARGALDVTDGRLAARFTPTGLAELAATTGRARYVAADGRSIAADRAGLTLAFDETSGLLRRASARAGGLDVAWPDGRRAAITEGRGELTFTPDGAPAELRADAGAFTYTRGAEALDAKGALLTARFDAAGLPTLVTGRGADVSYRSAAGAITSVGQLSFTAEAADGALRRLVVTGDEVRHQDASGLLTIGSGRLDATLDAGGLASLRADATRLAYAGATEDGRPLGLELARATVERTRREGGGERLSIATGAGRFVVDGRTVSLDGIERVQLDTQPSGEIDAFEVRVPGQAELVDRDGALRVVGRDLGARYDRAGASLRLDFGEVDLALRSQGLTAHVVGGAALLDERQVRVEVREATVLRTLGEQLQLHVESVTLDVQRTATGQLDQLSLSLGALDARIGAMNVLARTPSGERVRLHVTADADGNTVKEAYLQIPSGGEVRLQRDDLDVRLGGQLIRFERGRDGVHRLSAEGLDVDARTRSAEVRVRGGDAAVSLDPASGRLVIDQITGTRVDVKTGTTAVHLDLTEVRGLVANLTQLSGPVTGAALHLVPTGADSKLTAELRAEVGGLPFVFAVRDARALEAMGQLSTNQVHVLVRDPSGQGDLRIGAGPVDLRGSAIEVIGRYHAYDPGRMTEAVSAFVSTHGSQLFSGVRLEPDGALRLGTDRPGLNGELTVLLPRTAAQPGYRLDLTDAPAAAPGVIGTLGYRSGDWTASVFAGLVPGSHATLNVKQGELSIAGVPMPSRTDLPTTAIAGLRLDLGNAADGRLGLVGGAFANPAGRAQSPYLEERTPFGAFGGLEYTRGNFSLSGSAVVDVKDGRPELGGAMLRLGVRF